VEHKQELTMDNLDVVKNYVDLNKTRDRLSLDYIRTHYGIEKDKPEIEPKMIVVHWTAIDTLRESYNAMRSVRLPIHRFEIREGGTLNVGAHYLVDRDGTIYQLMPDLMFARHTIGLNLYAIGIENVGGNLSTPLTNEQLMANARLVRALVKRHNIEWLIGHFEYGQFRGTSLWLERDSTYFTQKIDPDPKFMAKLREATSDLGLQGPPKR
jgi:N-acetylmuramoyl-L-alanine amidase